MFFKRTNQIIGLLSDHISAVEKCYLAYMDGFKDIIQLQADHNFQALESLAKELTRLEHEADLVRHKVIFQLLSGGFLVDNRKSTMRLVEGLDQVADITQEIVKMIVNEQMDLDETFLNQLNVINNITAKQLNTFTKVLTDLLSKYELTSMIESIHDIEAYESQVDVIEDELIKVIFNKNLPIGEKLHYKELIKNVAYMSDLIEDLSDEVEIILASRRV